LRRASHAATPATLYAGQSDQRPAAAKPRVYRTARLDCAYTEVVARGWESKAVGEQIEAAQERTRAGARLTPEQIEQERKRDSLLLQRTRVMREIERCTDERYRKVLADGLAYLEAQLAGLGWRA
jgi:hypothetical protein